jgi:hypothetical protein
MVKKTIAKKKAETLFPEAKGTAQPSVSAAAALSFLKDTRGVTTWSPRLMTETLKISPKEAKQVLAILELQGYVKPAGKNEWMTTIAGEGVSGSKQPRYTPKRIEEALASLRSQIADVNRDSTAPFKITDAVAFGDFQSDRARVQSADVGILMVRQGGDSDDSESAKEHTAREEFLKERVGKTALLHLRPFEAWMRVRTHRNLLS